MTVLLCASDLRAAGWTEEFALGVGRLDQTDGEGDTAFIWDEAAESIDATFVRSNRTDRRYAVIGPLAEADQWEIGFSGLVTPIRATGSAPYIYAHSRIGFFDSQGSNAVNTLGVCFAEKVGDSPIFMAQGESSDGSDLLSEARLDFQYGVTYFVDCWLDGSSGVFSASLYEGVDETGPLVGTASVTVDPLTSLPFDSFGLTNIRKEADRVMELSIDRLSLVRPGPTNPDLDFDGDVDADDIDVLRDNLGDPAFDLDGDGDADEDDLIHLVEDLVELQDGSGRVGTKRGDFNLDGLVNGTDAAIMKAAFGTWPRGWAGGNANCDDIVNATDLAILAGNFGSEAPASTVPEPVTMSLLAVGGLALLKRRT